MLQKLSYNIQIALDSLFQRPLRSFLTSLGIIFGVGAVIAMMAIGQGAQEEILEQMEILGANNLIIEPIVEQKEEDLSEEAGNEQEGQRFSPGLTVRDGESIGALLKEVEAVSPEIVLESYFLYGARKRSGKLIGVSEAFFDLSGFELAKGKLFSASQLETAAPVCIIGHDVKGKFFAQEDPLGKRIKVGKNWLRIIGIARERRFSQASMMDLGIRDYDMDIYTPINTVLLRYKNRARVSPNDLREKSMRRHRRSEEEDTPREPVNYHQVDRMVIRISDKADMYKHAEIVRRMLQRRHNMVVDTEVKIPEELLAQKQRTSSIFNAVLISIAFISLLIGGIGIMNIMLASVMERIKEIGVRLSLGATKRDIIVQFLSEAVALSLMGGIFGIVMGVGLSLVIEQVSGVQTVISIFPIILSFFVAFSVGVMFGFFPARKAAMQDPVVSLRHE